MLGASLAILIPSSSLPVLAAAVALMVLGEMLVVPVSLAVAAELAPIHLRGSYQGALNLSWEAAWGPTSIVGLWLVGLGHGETLLALALPVAAIAAVLFLMLPAGRLQGPAPLVRTDPAPP